MALARTCWDRGDDADHIPDSAQRQGEIETNLWEATCLYCGKKIYKRTDDAGLFDPWMSRALVIVEWP